MLVLKKRLEIDEELGHVVELNSDEELEGSEVVEFEEIVHSVYFVEDAPVSVVVIVL